MNPKLASLLVWLIRLPPESVSMSHVLGLQVGIYVGSRDPDSGPRAFVARQQRIYH